ncbi:MAG: DUF1572 family protein [Sphingobacteriales bacterium]|nr:DUF1572 family protein [Sphingobacteriales bacterium]
MDSNYLSSIVKQFSYYKMLGDKTFAQLSDEQLFWQYHPDSNSIAIIVQHLWGNMLSRWTDFLTTDGEKESRRRDAEFEPDLQTRAELLEKWEAGWACLFQALQTITPNDWGREVYIRNQAHSITDAINRQLAHYAYHVGQIVWVGKMLCADNWVSLSIPKGKSGTFNAEKFAQSKHKAHFTDEFLSKP